LKQVTSYLFIIGLLLTAGCAEEETSRQSSDQQYFPLSVGVYQIYDVEGTRYLSQFQSEAFSYQLKTEVVDSFYTVDNVLTYVIYRSTRDTDQSAWEYLDTWSARVNDYEAVMNEGNTAYVKISFPVYKNKEWNGNKLNNESEEDIYKIESRGVKIPLDNGITFSDCIAIEQEDYIDAIQKDEREEIYARTIGLVYRKAIQLEFCEDVNCLGSQTIIAGTEYFQSLIEYGKN
jgi:hypothetical protein